MNNLASVYLVRLRGEQIQNQEAAIRIYQQVLTLRDLLDSKLDIKAIRLVVLSACQTGITDFQNVPDEAIGQKKTSALPHPQTSLRRMATLRRNGT